MLGCMTRQPRRPISPSFDDGIHFQRSFSAREPIRRNSAPIRKLRVDEEQKQSGSKITAKPSFIPLAIDPRKKKLDKWIGNLFDSNEGKSRNAIADHRARDWQYSNDVRVSMAPLASVDDDEITLSSRLPREQRDYGKAPIPNIQMTQREISPIYQQGIRKPPEYNNYREQTYRGDDYMVRSIETGSQLDQMNVVFLQANDEVKRAILPPLCANMDQVKMAFVRSFPNLTRNFIEQPNVKIYMQEQSKNGGQLFYELEDPREIRNKSVLKLRESYSTLPNSPTRFLDHPDYHSETENDDRHRFISLARPASAMGAVMGGGDYGPPKPFRSKTFDNYNSSDSYASDTSSHASFNRSTSATPVIDRESRVRMETMERQLAGLSSLVHSALVSKGMSENSHKDMAALRREILALHPDTVRESSEERSIPDSASSFGSNNQALGSLRNKLHQANTECQHLRRNAQANAVSARGLIKEAGDEILRILDAKLHNGTEKKDNTKEVDTEQYKNEHSLKLNKLMETLSKFENSVECVRNSVLESNKKLRMSEVEKLTEQLTEIGRNAATLKNDFPVVQNQIEKRIKKDMERIVREEKFIRDQSSVVDQSLRRCKALANIMVTMKKLAMVQDPAIHKTKSNKDLSITNGISVAHNPPPPADPTSDSPMVTGPPAIPKKPHTNLISAAHLTSNGPPQTVTVAPPPPVPPAPQQYTSPADTLDGVLQEVGTPTMPPRPPSRFSVQDVRTKFTKPPELPDQIKNLIEDAARRASPSLDTSQSYEKRQELEERQERLAEKQRKLRSQFEQLQQLTPL